jgi:hypothetical protein
VGSSSPDIDEKDRLAMKLELLPAEDLEHFVESSNAARQNREGVGLLGHQPLAFVHAVGDQQFGHAVMGQFGISKPRRDDPGHIAARRQHRVSQETHEPDPPATVHQPDPAAARRAPTSPLPGIVRRPPPTSRNRRITVGYSASVLTRPGAALRDAGEVASACTEANSVHCNLMIDARICAAGFWSARL